MSLLQGWEVSLRLVSYVALALLFLCIACFFALLGQLDIILAPWYGDPKATWAMPLVSLHWGASGLAGFNGPGAVISSNDAWPTIYGYLTGSFLLGILMAFAIGRATR